MGVLGGSAAASRECKLDITRGGSHSMGLLPSLGTLKYTAEPCSVGALPAGTLFTISDFLRCNERV